MYFPHKSGIFVNTRKLKHRAKTHLFLPGIYLTLIGKSRKQNPKIGKSPTVFHGNKIQKNFKNPDLGTSPGVIYGNKIQAKILSTWS